MEDNFERYENKKVVLQNPELYYRKEKEFRRVNGLKEQLEWIKRQLEYVNFAEKYKLRVECKMGEIYEIDWGVNVNAEFSNRHYGLVIRDSSQFDPLVYVVPLKSKHSESNKASDVDLGIIEELNPGTRTIAVINQIRALDKMRIFSKSTIGETDIYEEKIPVLDSKKMQLVLTAIYAFYFTGFKGINSK